MTLKVHIVRHGETQWSLSGQHTGRTDIPLTTHGEQLARELGSHLKAIAFASVLTSPLQRARQTCERVVPDSMPEIDPNLAEWDYGDFEGLTTAEILRSRPGWSLFRDGSPGGETPAQVSARADDVINRLVELDGNIAIFSHGHFSRVLGARWIGLSIEHAQSFLLDTASLCVLGYEHDRSDQPAIALWNSTLSP